MTQAPPCLATPERPPSQHRQRAGRCGPPAPKPGAAGFTLLELLMTLGLSAVLACIAYPAWQGLWLKAQRAQARSALSAIHSAQLGFRLQHNRWAQSLQELNAPAEDPSGRYALSLQADAEGWRSLARALGPQAADTGCSVLELRVTSHTLHRRAHSSAGPLTDAAPIARCWGE
jgi:type IV pilus assembly protein PilE